MVLDIQTIMVQLVAQVVVDQKILMLLLVEQEQLGKEIEGATGLMQELQVAVAVVVREQ
jgi:hypothetical protein